MGGGGGINAWKLFGTHGINFSKHVCEGKSSKIDDSCEYTQLGFVFSSQRAPQVVNIVIKC